MAKPVSDTGFRPIQIEGGDGETYARGRVELATGTEQKPCLTCKSWERDERKLVQYLMSRSMLQVQPDGTFRHKDPRQRSLVIDPKSWGWCRRQSIATDSQASCEQWTQIRTREELRTRISQRR